MTWNSLSCAEHIYRPGVAGSAVPADARAVYYRSKQPLCRRRRLPAARAHAVGKALVEFAVHGVRYAWSVAGLLLSDPVAEGIRPTQDIDTIVEATSLGQHTRQCRWVVRMLTVARGDLSDARIIRLLQQHLARARAETAPGSAHAFDLDALRGPDIRFFAAWNEGALLGVGALRRLSDTHGEIKSMHTAERARSRGVGGVILERLLAEARSEGLRRVSLETGSWNYFEPARCFYRRRGFINCPPFADYRPDPNSVFMTLQLDP